MYLTLRELLKSWCYLCVIVVVIFNRNYDCVCFCIIEGIIEMVGGGRGKDPPKGT
jgi:hypothetical protein